MGDTRTSSVILIDGDGESTIVRTGGGEYPYRLGEKGIPNHGESPNMDIPPQRGYPNNLGARESPEDGGIPSAVTVNGEFPNTGQPQQNRDFPLGNDVAPDIKLVASVMVTRDAAGIPYGSTWKPKDSPMTSQQNGEYSNGDQDPYSIIDKTKQNEYQEVPRESPIGYRNLAYHHSNDHIDGNQRAPQPEVQEPETGEYPNQGESPNHRESPTQMESADKQWQFAEDADDVTENELYQTIPENRNTELPTVNGFVKTHNYEKGLGSNGVGSGVVFPDHRRVDYDAPPEKGAAAGQGAGLEGAEDRERKRQEKRDRKPLFYVKLVCNHPKKAFGIALAGHLSFLVITAILFAIGYDVMPVVFDRLPLDIVDDADYLRGLAWDHRNENDEIVLRGSSAKGQEMGTTLFENMVVIFDQEGGNVFTSENLRIIQRVENEFFNIASYQQKYCLRDSENRCSKPQSVLRFFDGTFKYLDAVFDDADFSDVTATLYAAQTYDDTKELLSLLVAKGANMTSSKAESWITRIFFPVGWPLEGYTATYDREEEQKTEIEKFYKEKLMPLGDDYFSGDSVGEMKFSYGSRQVQELYLFNQVMMDLMLAFGSFMFIAIFMRIQTGSFWITGFAIMSILTSFAGANLIYRVIIDFRYIGIFHILSVFIILGIGADDVFIFVDSWKETAHYQYHSLAHRLSDVYRRASLAMFFTSLTTAMAFAVSATSPFLAVYSFGVFSCILVTVNYISIIVFFPTVVITYHLYWEKYKFCCCCQKDGGTETASPNSPKDGARRSHPVVRFFHGPYFRLITHPVARWVILGFYAALLSVFIYFASQIEVNQEQTKFVSEDTNLGYYLSRASSGSFEGLSVRRSREVYIIWGLDPQDLGPCHKTDALCVGSTVWDEKFDMNSFENQRAFQQLCDDLINLDSKTIEELFIKVNSRTNLPEINCFSQHLNTFLQEEQDRVINGTRRYPSGMHLSYPVNVTMIDDVMENNPRIYTSNVTNSTLETAMSFWLYNGFQPDSRGWKQNLKFELYNPLLGESKDNSSVINSAVGFDYYYGTSLKYMAITINTTIFGPTLGYTDGIPLRDKWEEFINTKMATLPEGLRRGFQTTPAEDGFNLWHWVKVQKSLVNTALQGIIVGLCVALPILMIATLNLISGLYATLTLVCITTMVLGLIPLAGWKIGILESLNLVLVVGLAVDYVVHLAEGYGRSEHVTRQERTRDALTEVGISVLSGAVTTLGASLFMLGAKILFFIQFGVFVLTTLGFSLLFALGFFMTVCALIGPQNNTGSIKAIAKCCKS